MDFLSAMGYDDSDIKNLDLSERIKARKEANEIREAAGKLDLDGIKFDSTNTHLVKTGTTASGKRFRWYAIEFGLTATSQYCGKLAIDGKTVFTRGSLHAALKYLAG